MPENRLSSYLSTLEVCKRDEPIAHRTGATAAGDLIAAPTITAAKDDAHVGVMAAAEHKIAVAVGTCYGYSVRSDIVAITPTENKCVLLTIPQVVGAESYVIFFSTDAAPKRLAEVTEAQRAAGCSITAVEVVGAPYAAQPAGTVTLKLVGTGADAGLPGFEIAAVHDASPVQSSGQRRVGRRGSVNARRVSCR